VITNAMSQIYSINSILSFVGTRVELSCERFYCIT
jgi:hypothetical protein